MAASWLSREYRDGDEEGIVALHREVFGSEADRAWWEWRYLRNPAGRAVIMVAESNGRIVGQYALVPVRMKVGNEEGLGSLSLDTMVHPDFRGAGMFTKLAEAAYAAASSRGIRFVYGFPNANSHHGFASRLGWRDLDQAVPLWAYPLNFKGVLRKRLGRAGSLAAPPARVGWGMLTRFTRRLRKPCTECSVREITCFDERFDGLWKRISVRYPIALIRDGAYLNWRYTERPNANYSIFTAEQREQLVGCVVLRSMSKFGLQIGFVMEMIIAPESPDAGAVLFSVARARFRREGMDIVGCLVPSGSPDAGMFRRMGFRRVPRRLLPQDMFWGVRGFQETDHYLADPANWYISWGDHDSV